MNRYEATEDDRGWEVVVAGPTLEELFELAAYAAFDLTYELHDLQPTYSRPVVAPGDTAADLLANWIEELIWSSRDAGIAFCLFNVDRLEEGGVQGSASGMPVAEAVRRPWAAAGVVAVEPPVQVPEGWWVRFTLRRERPIGIVP